MPAFERTYISFYDVDGGMVARASGSYAVRELVSVLVWISLAFGAWLVLTCFAFAAMLAALGS